MSGLCNFLGNVVGMFVINDAVVSGVFPKLWYIINFSCTYLLSIFLIVCGHLYELESLNFGGPFEYPWNLNSYVKTFSSGKLISSGFVVLGLVAIVAFFDKFEFVCLKIIFY
jgi:hypothetical protein